MSKVKYFNAHLYLTPS